MSENPLKVFISYSSGQRDLARHVADVIEESGMHAWFAEDEVEVGDSVTEKIREGLDRSDAVVLLIGDGQTAWTQFERSEVLKRTWGAHEPVVLPVIVGDAAPPGYLRDRFVLHLDSVGDGLDEIVTSLRNVEPWAVGRTDEATQRLDDRLAAIEAAAEAEALTGEGR